MKLNSNRENIVSRFFREPGPNRIHITNLLLLGKDQWLIIKSVKDDIQQFQRTMPLITDLKNPAMRDRHWLMIKEEFCIQLYTKSSQVLGNNIFSNLYTLIYLKRKFSNANENKNISDKIWLILEPIQRKQTKHVELISS